MLPLLSRSIRVNTLIFSNCKFKVISIMSKDRSYIPVIQKNRLQNREKKSKSDVGHAYLQILGSGANGAAKSVYLFTDLSRYAFNVGEGTQRISHEHKIKISKLEHIFVTTAIWENIGGLPGLALTVQECGVPNITLHGPSGLELIFKATKRFVILNHLQIKTSECNRNETYQDDAVVVKYVPLTSNVKIDNFDHSDTEVLKKINDAQEIIDDIDYYSYLKGNKPETIAPSTSSVTTFINNSINAKALTTSMAYICNLTSKLGSLSLEMCVEKGVPPGPLLGKLKNGEDVYLPNGTLVKAKDVKQPDMPGIFFISMVAYVLVVECPTLDFLDSLLNEEEFKKHQTGSLTENDIPKYVIHFTPSAIMNEERYQTWMKRFPSTTLHVNVNDSNTCMGCVGTHEMQHKLNLLDPKTFPLLKDKSILISPSMKPAHEPDDILARARKRILEPHEPLENEIKRLHMNIPDDIGNTLRVLPLRPFDFYNFRYSDCVHINPDDIKDEVFYIQGFTEELKILKEKLEHMSQRRKNLHEEFPYPVITFLGTGSCIPNKCRNTSAILVTLEHHNHILMDCGEGTYGQLIRHFGSDRTEEILAYLNIIFISHLHADHHIGLINLLKHRRQSVKKLGLGLEKMLLLAPKTILPWLHGYHQQFEEILDCIDFVPNQEMEYRYQTDRPDSKFYEVAPLKSITTSYVIHCPHSFGISMTHSNGFKITYSGDTMPSKDLIQIGQNSHLLIHEATFEDDLVKEARAKLHSTTTEAINVGMRMEAKYTILTHFSQRYAKIPFIDDSFNDNVGIAFDNMEVSMSNLPVIHLFNPALKIMFSEDHELLVYRNCKRKRITKSIESLV